MSCCVLNLFTNEYLNSLRIELIHLSGEFGLELGLLVGTDQEKQGLVAEMLWSTLC